MIYNQPSLATGSFTMDLPDNGDVGAEFIINHNAAIISGGELGSRQWVCETIAVHGTAFVHLDKQSKSLATAMGLNTKARWPWRGCDAIKFMSDKRDAAVDKHVFDQLQSDDPLADTTSTPEKALGSVAARRAGTLRQQALQKNEIPEMMDVEMPSFQSGGVTVEPFTVNVLKPSKRGGKLFMRLDEEDLSWLKKLCKSSGVLDGEDDDEPRPDGLCDIDQPNVKWTKRNGSFHLACKYKSQSGSVKRRYVNPFAKNCANIDVQHDTVKEVAEQVQNFYEANHYP